MTGGGDDIKGYLNIIEGKFPVAQDDSSDSSIYLGVSIAGVEQGNVYIYDNGLRWAKILQEDDNFWSFEHGFLEYGADSVGYISKNDMTDMIRSGEMLLEKKQKNTPNILEEMLSLNDTEFDIFLEKVERYLFINEEKDYDDYTYDWNDAWSTGKSPVDAAEEAILLGV
jgi:hypothetical protein